MKIRNKIRPNRRKSTGFNCRGVFSAVLKILLVVGVCGWIAGASYVAGVKSVNTALEIDALNQMTTVRYYFSVCKHPEFNGNPPEKLLERYRQWVREDFDIDISGIDDAELITWVNEIKGGKSCTVKMNMSHMDSSGKKGCCR